MKATKDRHAATKNMLLDAVDGVELVNKEEAGVAILELQTRLQASYQTTSILSQLSLVNYLYRYQLRGLKGVDGRAGPGHDDGGCDLRRHARLQAGHRRLGWSMPSRHCRRFRRAHAAQARGDLAVDGDRGSPSRSGFGSLISESVWLKMNRPRLAMFCLIGRGQRVLRRASPT